MRHASERRDPYRRPRVPTRRAGVLPLIALLVAAVVVSEAGALETGTGAALDPQDGPHVDLSVAIEDGVVSVQMHMNLAFADHLVDVARESPDEVHAVEQQSLQAALAAWARRENVVAIDGIVVDPVVTGFRFAPADPMLIPLFPRYGPRAVARVSLLLDYPAKSPPQRVRLVWGAFPPDASWMGEGEAPPQLIRARLAAGGATELITFSADEPEHVWHGATDLPGQRFQEVPDVARPGVLPLPAVSAGLVATWLLAAFALRRRVAARRLLLWLGPVVLLGAWMGRGTAVVAVPDPFGWAAPLPDATEALAIFRPLHANIYRAFDYTDPGDVYDALQRSVDGELLDSLYDQVYRGLIMQEHGGAVASVQAVRLAETSVDATGRFGDEGRVVFSVTARWQVDGVVLHWGHTHERTNEYRARYAVVQRDEGWRIAGSEVIESRRIETSIPPEWKDL